MKNLRPILLSSLQLQALARNRRFKLIQPEMLQLEILLKC